MQFLEGEDAVNRPCDPSPCGANSRCRVVDNTSVCTCLPTFLGNPPFCRPECSVSAECSFNLACIKNKCDDPCPGLCGSNTRCETINHNAICSCRLGFTGDPFVACFEMPRKNHSKAGIFNRNPSNIC